MDTGKGVYTILEKGGWVIKVKKCPPSLASTNKFDSIHKSEAKKEGQTNNNSFRVSELYKENISL